MKTRKLFIGHKQMEMHANQKVELRQHKGMMLTEFVFNSEL